MNLNRLLVGSWNAWHGNSSGQTYVYTLQIVSLHFTFPFFNNFVDFFFLKYKIIMQVVREIEIYASRTGASDNPIGQWAWALQHGYTAYYEVEMSQHIC